MHLADHFALHY